MPRVLVGGIEVGGMTVQEAKEVLEAKGNNTLGETFIFGFQEYYYEEKGQDLGFEYDIDKAIQFVKNIGKENFLYSLFYLFSSPFYPLEFSPGAAASSDKFKSFEEKLRRDIDKDVTTSQVEVRDSQLHFVEGKDGHLVDDEALMAKITKNLERFEAGVIKIPVKFVSAGLKTQDAPLAIEAVNKFLNKKITLTFEDRSWRLDGQDIIPMLTFSKNGGIKVDLNEKKASNFILEIASEIDQEAQEPKLTIEDGKAKVFQPAKDGLKLDQQKTKAELVRVILSDKNEEKIVLLAVRSSTRVKTEEVNSLGIKEIIGRGVSNFAGSSPERVFNIELAASKVSGTLVAPGEVFSFNQSVGDVSQETGYKTAYIIERGRTLFGAGGGVCQVSTTAFRAAMYSGLPLVERRTHAYRVRYYEQAGHPPGMDATIYQPSVDFKFKNDTPNWILITAKTDRKTSNLTFEFWGTKDGRAVEISKPQVSNVTAPPDPLYEEDPTLPKGVVKQADFAAWGASVRIKRKVMRNGETLIDEEIFSRYKPWRAIFKVGVGG